MSRITITLDQTIIDQAKIYAKERQDSLSHIIENYLKQLVQEESKAKAELTPIVKSLKGSFEGNISKNYKNELANTISEKYPY